MHAGISIGRINRRKGGTIEGRQEEGVEGRNKEDTKKERQTE